MKKISSYKPTWAQIMKNDIAFYKNLSEQQAAEITNLRKIIAMIQPHFSSPPTVMIACEKIVEAAAQLATTANAMLQRREQDYAKRT